MKKIIILLLLLTFVATGAFAVNFSLGASGALYMTSEEYDDSTGGDIWDRFEEGENVYYGVNAELLFDKVGLGLYTYFSFYEVNDFAWDYEMMDADINLSLSYHFFGATAFLDPFVEAGFGQITRSVTAVDYYDDNGMTELDEPFVFLGTEYWFAGFGLGINLGGLGGFAKVQYHHPTGTVDVETDNDGIVYNYSTDYFPLNDLKVVLGLKIIF